SSTPVASVSPETDARASTTWRLQPPSASLVLWRKPRNPPSVAACALDPGVDATAAARSERRSRLPFTAVHRTVHRPQHLHGSSPSTLDARVPAIQRSSARSHRTVDNSLITSRIEYSHSSWSSQLHSIKCRPAFLPFNWLQAVAVGFFEVGNYVAVCNVIVQRICLEIIACKSMSLPEGQL